MNLTVEQRDRLLAILPKHEKKPTGRPRTDLVKVLDGILFVLTTGCRWEDIDKDRYASYQTCHLYFQQWEKDGTFEKPLKILIDGCGNVGLLSLHESFIDGSFVRAKKGAMR
jgi:transposase